MIKILIIDDTRSVHAFVKNLLSKSKEVECVSAYNGAEGLEILKSNLNFDIVLLDWEMPIMNGPAAFEEMLKQNIKIPTLMMTTKNSVEDIQRMLNLGVAEYLLKPFTIDILFSKLEFVTGKVLPYAA